MSHPRRSRSTDERSFAYFQHSQNASTVRSCLRPIAILVTSGLPHSHARTHYDLSEFVARDNVREYVLSILTDLVGSPQSAFVLGTGTEHEAVRRLGDRLRDVKSMDRILGVLISGRGSNLQAIIDAIACGSLDARIAVVISNRSDAAGLERAKNSGIETVVLDHRGCDRDEYDLMLIRRVEEASGKAGLPCWLYADLRPKLYRGFSECVIEYPSFVAARVSGHRRTSTGCASRVKLSGVTVHLVTGELDAGPIVAQASVQGTDDDTPEALAARILIQEHRIYPEAISLVLDGTWQVIGRRFVRSGEPSNHTESKAKESIGFQPINRQHAS